MFFTDLFSLCGEIRKLVIVLLSASGVSSCECDLCKNYVKCERKMDVYGYQSFQYNQSDELAKQMFAQQALASVPFTGGMSEPPSMPAPSGAPWNSQGLPWGLPSPPQLVQFTAQPPPMELKVPPVIHCKRKSLDVEPAM